MVEGSNSQWEFKNRRDVLFGVVLDFLLRGYRRSQKRHVRNTKGGEDENECFLKLAEYK